MGRPRGVETGVRKPGKSQVVIHVGFLKKYNTCTDPLEKQLVP